MTTFTPIEGLIGGLLIGSAVALWLWLYGRITGISGIVGGLILDNEPTERGWRFIYLVGLVCGVLLYQFLIRHGLPGTHFTVDLQVAWPVMIAAGLLVGFGTRMGHGCTSGHGVCGLARFSRRSMVATATFILFGFITVSIVRHVFGVAP